MARYQIVSQWNLDHPLQVLSISSSLSYSQPKNQVRKTSVKKKSNFGLWLFIIIVFFIIVSSYQKIEKPSTISTEKTQPELVTTPVYEPSKLNNETVNKKIQETKESSKKSITSKSVISVTENKTVADSSESEEDKSSEIKKTNKNEASKDLSSLKDL